jgi:hypothetical protein
MGFFKMPFWVYIVFIVGAFLLTGAFLPIGCIFNNKSFLKNPQKMGIN